MAHAYKLVDVDGEVSLLVGETFGQFMLDNDFHPETVEDIEGLGVGEVYADGGGASPEWSLTRVS